MDRQTDGIAMAYTHYSIYTVARKNSKLTVFLSNMARLNIPDEAYNWIVDFCAGRGHTTKFGGEMSELAELESSVIQGSSLGPAAYIVTASDLWPEHADNEIIKFADDTYLIIPAMQ